MGSKKSRSQKTLSILTQNCYIPAIFSKQARMKRLSNFARNKCFEILCLQELLFSRDMNPFKSHFISYFVRGRFGPKGGLAILSKQKAKSVLFYKFKDQGKLKSEQFFDRLIEKGALVVRFDDFTVINTHLVSTYLNNKREVLASHRQTKELAEIIVGEQKLSKRLILAGDVNFGPSSHQYEYLKTLLIDKTTNLGPSAHLGGRQLDYIFANEGDAVANVHAHPVNISDHPGISIYLTF